MDELVRVPLELKRIPHRELERPHRELELVSVRSFGRVWITGYLIRWLGDEPRPLVVHGHGYGSECAERWDWSESGFNVFGIDIRGFGRSFEASPLRSSYGYILTGCETPETSVLRGAVCDYIRAVEAARAIVGGMTTRVVLHGASFSGALAMMAEGLLHVADLLAVAVPTFGWMEGRHFFATSGSAAEVGRYLKERPEQAEDLMLVLRYFDAMNFADRIACPSLIGVGIADDVVPANTVYAVANHLQGPREVMEFPVSHSSQPEEVLWENFDARWIDLAQRGCLDDVGISALRD